MRWLSIPPGGSGGRRGGAAPAEVSRGRFLCDVASVSAAAITLRGGGRSWGACRVKRCAGGDAGRQPSSWGGVSSQAETPPMRDTRTLLSELGSVVDDANAARAQVRALWFTLGSLDVTATYGLCG